MLVPKYIVQGEFEKAQALIDSCSAPWDMSESPLFFHMTADAAPEKQDEQYAFLCANEEFQKMLQQYKEASN